MGGLLGVAQALLVVDSELGQGLLEVDASFGNVHSDQGAQEALARRVTFEAAFDVAPGAEDVTAVDDEHGRGVDLLGELAGTRDAVT
ncbi:MAG: hypothetical protein GY711_18110 [bacterium]|nr:hypothetical protein [bacterium]